MAAIEGAGNKSSVSVSVEFGLVRGLVRGEQTAYETGASVESVLRKLAPTAPAEYVHHAAQVLEGILGIGGEDES